MGNPFNEAQWETSSVKDILGEGNHLVTIESVDGTGTSSGGHPQLEVTASNDVGSIKDWIVVIPAALWRATSLFAACGLEKPEDGQVKEEGTGFRIATAYTDQCVGKRVGVLVRLEPDRDDPTKTRNRVKGWTTPDQLATDVPVDTSDLDGVPAGSVDADSIPF